MSIPEGATHVVADIYSLRDEQKVMNNKYPHRKKDGDTWLAFVDGEWVNVFFPDPSRYQKINKPWSGPEDGLPPIGMTVQVWDKEPHKFYAKHCGKSVEVLAHRTGSYGEVVAVYCVRMDDGTDEYHALVETCFRPIQSEPDARQKAIREIMDAAGIDCLVTATRLVDAGFKREVV